MAAPEEEDGSFFMRDDGGLDFARPSHATASGPSTSRSDALTAIAAVEDAPATSSHVDTTRESPSRLSPTLQSAHPTAPQSSRMANPPVLNRAFWQRRIRASTSFGITIGAITDKLGLRRIHRSRGKQVFTGAAAEQLASSVSVLASRLPNDAERLVEIALSTGLLRAITEYLVETYGERIWGESEEAKREELYDEGEVELYERRLRVKDAEDREV
jgi:hypothetical protein